MTRTVLAALLVLLAAAPLLADAPPRVSAEMTDGLPPAASAKGKYRNLLRVLKVPGDKANYGEFHDYGMYTGNSWAGYNNLPAGYWVYAYPKWYIWKDAK